MKFWTLEYHDGNSASGTVREFFATKQSARAAARTLNREPPDGSDVHPLGEPVQIDVPTTRAELLDWLNRNAAVR